MPRSEQQYERDFDAVTLAVWERWTGNGRGLDHDSREQTIKSARDAVANAYIDGIGVAEWQQQALAALSN